MNTTVDDQTLLDDAKWHAWVEKGKVRDRARAVKYRWVGGFCIVVIALAGGYYFGGGR